MTAAEIRTFLDAHGMEVRPKSASRLMRAIGWLLAACCINRHFLDRYTSVIWLHVYYPSSWGAFDLASDSDVEAHAVTFEHEFVHTQQRKRWHVLWAMSYLLLPLPFGLAWFRWYWERPAYLVNMRHGRTAEQCADALWRYGWPWPRARMLAWFEAQDVTGGE